MICIVLPGWKVRDWGERLYVMNSRFWGEGRKKQYIYREAGCFVFAQQRFDGHWGRGKTIADSAA